MDADRRAAVAQAIEQGADHLLVTEEGVPVVVLEVGGDDGRPLAVALLHQLEEDVGLLGAEVEVAHLVDHEEVDLHQSIDQLAGGVVGEAAVHLVEELLGLDEEAAVAGLQGPQQDRAGEAGLADAGGADEDEVLGAREEVERGELEDRGLADAGLELPRVGLERPPLGQARTVDTVLEEADLLALVLLAQQTREEVGVARSLGLGVGELAPEDRPDPRELQAREQLIEVIRGRDRRRRRRRCRARGPRRR